MASTKKKTTKNASAPKNARSPYIFFTMEHSGKVKESNPGIALPGISAKVGALWTALSEEDREPYKKLAKNDKERYLQEKEEYLRKKAEEGDNEEEVEAEEEEPKNKKKRASPTTTKKKPAGFPKGSSSAYLHYQISVQKDVRAENPGITIGGVAKHCSLKWKEMTTEERAPYQKRADEDRARYLAELAVFNSLNHSLSPPSTGEEEGEVEEEEKVEKPEKKRSSSSSLSLTKTKASSSSPSSSMTKTTTKVVKETIVFERTPALQYFIDMCKPDVQSTNPNLSVEDIEYLLFGRWNGLPDGKRLVYERCVANTMSK